MTWELALVPALLCFLAGILAAATWLEQGLLVHHQVVLLMVTDQATSQRQGDALAVGEPWADDTSRLVA
jgi:hypothetical protein